MEEIPYHLMQVERLQAKAVLGAVLNFRSWCFRRVDKFELTGHTGGRAYRSLDCVPSMDAALAINPTYRMADINEAFPGQAIIPIAIAEKSY